MPRLKDNWFVTLTDQVDYVSLETARIPDDFGSARRQPLLIKCGFADFEAERRSRWPARANFPTHCVARFQNQQNLTTAGNYRSATQENFEVSVTLLECTAIRCVSRQARVWPQSRAVAQDLQPKLD